MTKEALIKYAKSLWEEAYASDPFHTEEVTLAVLGREVFTWHLLTMRELHALTRLTLSIALQARG